MTEQRNSSLSSEYARWWRRLSSDERASLIESGAFRADDPSDCTPLESRSRVNGQNFDFMRAEDEKSYSDPTREMSMKSQHPSTLEQVIANEDATLTDPRLASLDLASLRLRATLHFLLDGLDESTDVGPLINPASVAKVTEYVELGRGEGELVCGGSGATASSPGVRT